MEEKKKPNLCLNKNHVDAKGTYIINIIKESSCLANEHKWNKNTYSQLNLAQKNQMLDLCIHSKCNWIDQFLGFFFAIHKPKNKTKQFENNETINKQLAATRVEYILLQIALCALVKWKSTLCVRVVSMGGHWPIMIERSIRSWKFVVRVKQKQRDEWREINNNNEKT